MIQENFLVFIMLFFFVVILIDMLVKNIRLLYFKIFVNFIKGIWGLVFFLFIFRSFIIEPFRIPSRSMVPSLYDGDFILVNKFIYGLKIPIINKKIVNFTSPKKGDVVVFKHFSGKNYVKRVIGESGDHVKYDNENLYINDNLIIKLYFAENIDISANNMILFPVEYYEEEIVNNICYNINMRPFVSLVYYMVDDVIIPDNSYFFIGDNRNTSYDSRFWGVVHDDDIMGKVFFVWFSWDMYYKNVRWDRVCINIL